MKVVLLKALMISSFLSGFFCSLSFVRALSGSFRWHTRELLGGRPDFGFLLSTLLLAASLATFAFAIWFTKPLTTPPSRRMDYSVLAIMCVIGFYISHHILVGRLNFWLFWFPGSPSPLIFSPIVAYALAMLCFGELVARLRDKSLIQTLYWIHFVKAFPLRKSFGFIVLLLLASQLYTALLFLSNSMFISLNSINLFTFILSLFSICALTYVSAYLTNLSKEYNEAYDKATAEKIRAERFKAELITNVSHDIKTPLTSIINYVDLLKNEDMQGQSAEYIQVLDNKSARLKTLIDDLMEASKVSTGNMKVDLQEINLGEILGQAAGEFEDIIAERNLTLIIRQPDTPVLVRADNRLLYRVLENLFSNTVKYALGGTRVFAEISVQYNQPHIIVQNTSENPINITDGEATEQFIRGDKSRQTEGSGLGLYIAKSLVELMGGKLAITIHGDLFRVDVCL